LVLIAALNRRGAAATSGEDKGDESARGDQHDNGEQQTGQQQIPGRPAGQQHRGGDSAANAYEWAFENPLLFAFL
jgi:hypothetical protein